MTVATHRIKIFGSFEKKKWDENKIKKYVRKKIICNINDSFHTNLELFKIIEDKIEVNVLIFALPSEVSNEIIEKWLKQNITEDGITVMHFSIEKLVDITENGWRNIPFINIPLFPFEDISEEERKWFVERYFKNKTY
jgi:hypothetical protein